MKKLALAALLAASLGVAHADVIRFEGVATSSAIPAGYGGVNWSNFYRLDVTPASACWPRSRVAVRSEDLVTRAIANAPLRAKLT